MEYAIEAAALFNPSIVQHPDQRHLEKGSLRFIMSLRATGEGHVSSIVFRSGVLDRNNKFLLDPISDFVETPDLQPDPVYKRKVFQRKLNEMGAIQEITAHILKRMSEDFTYNELSDKIALLRAKPLFSKEHQNRTFEVMRWLADSNYEVNFHADHHISERVIFPVSKNESRGIEDARFVQFFDDRQDFTYYATYTAYNGFTILPQMIETKDFIKFKVITLNGKAVQNKGMALFPRKIGGRYAMLLDLENPAKVIARLEAPLIAPREKDREGYVPNVVYTCGAIFHGGVLVIPYGMSDIKTGIATVDVSELIKCMRAVA